MNRRSFLQCAGVVAGVSLVSGAALAAPPDLQALLDAGAPLPAGVYAVDRTLLARGPVMGAGAGSTVLVATSGLHGPVLMGAEPVAVTHLSVERGRHVTRIGARGVRVATLGHAG